jgi:hypothetical protein
LAIRRLLEGGFPSLAISWQEDLIFPLASLPAAQRAKSWR